jgi:phenylacetate-CoA ligase
MRVDQFFFRSFVYVPVTYLRGQNVTGNLKELQATERLPSADLRNLQERLLSRLVKEVREAVPAYRHRLHGVGPNGVTLEELRNVPTLDKQTLRENYADFLHVSPRLFSVEKTTGGSTGEPVTVRKSRHAMAWELAATWRGYGWAGIQMGDLQARFWGVPITRMGRMRAAMIDFVCHRSRFSAFDFDRADFVQYDALLRARRPDYFYGYVSMLAELARWYLETGRRLPSPPKAIVTTSEVLSPDDRFAIESAFQCRVFNEYGCGELGTIAHECDHGRLHTSDENMIVEILDGDRPCASGEKGEIVVTDLRNTALPLVRYRTGDFGAVSHAHCPCGRELGTLETVYGRAYDFIETPDGRRFHAEFLIYMFEEAQRQDMGIAQFRVVQEAPDRLEVFVVPSMNGFAASEERRLVHRMRELLGNGLNIGVHRVSRLERESSGKMRVIVGLKGSRSRIGIPE